MTHALKVLLLFVSSLFLAQTGFAEAGQLAQDKIAFEEEFARALDRNDNSPVSEAVVSELKCRFLVIDLAARVQGVDEVDAGMNVLIQEALKHKVYGGSYAKILELWNEFKDPEALVELCPKTKALVDLILDNEPSAPQPLEAEEAQGPNAPQEQPASKEDRTQEERDPNAWRTRA